MIDARTHLTSLVGREIRTVSGRPNVVLAVEGADVIVGTSRSPHGQPVPIAWVQQALDALERDREIVVDVPTLGYRSEFVGAVLATFSGAVLMPTSPPRIRLGD